jgi:hypothetical protein
MRIIIGQLAIAFLVVGGLGLSYLGLVSGSIDKVIPLLIWTLLFIPLGIWTRKNPSRAFMIILLLYITSVVIKNIFIGGEYILTFLFHIYFIVSMFIGSAAKLHAPDIYSSTSTDFQDLSSKTGEDFEFLITPGDIEIKPEDFDSVMTPDKVSWAKIIRNGWVYYQVGNDDFSYSYEMAGIQMTFNPEIKYSKAKTIADEVAVKLARYSGKSVAIHYMTKDKLIAIS